ncbi:MAG TPA: zinc ribbon domain-containing protein [Acidimicrobiales bacterium]|nr:zinc ribbon domain-containing protein [Acidimicrobiales bacterium]
MPLYDFRCRTCGDTYEVRRTMAEAEDPAPCPQGHRDTVRLLPLVSVGGRAAASRSLASPSRASAMPAGGGCCGGACGCG